MGDVDVEYRAGFGPADTEPRFIWECPTCGRDCHHVINAHPDSPAMQRLEERIKDEPRCKICLMRAGLYEPPTLDLTGGRND